MFTLKTTLLQKIIAAISSCNIELIPVSNVAFTCACGGCDGGCTSCAGCQGPSR